MEMTGMENYSPRKTGEDIPQRARRTQRKIKAGTGLIVWSMGDYGEKLKVRGSRRARRGYLHF
jgi:hypothetical protein